MAMGELSLESQTIIGEAQAAFGGVQQSWRPWTITPGILRNFSAPLSSWPSSSQPFATM